MTNPEDLQERQEILERALEQRVRGRLEFQWGLDPIGRLHGIARFSGNESVSFWILPSGETVAVH